MLAALHCRKYLQDSSRETCVWLEGWMKKNKEKQQPLTKLIEKPNITAGSGSTLHF